MRVSLPSPPLPPFLFRSAMGPRHAPLHTHAPRWRSRRSARTTTGVLAKLKWLDLTHTQVSDAGCATLVAALNSGALPALKTLFLQGIPASAAAQASVYKARDGLLEEWGSESEEDAVEDEDEEGEGEEEDGGGS